MSYFVSYNFVSHCLREASLFLIFIIMLRFTFYISYQNTFRGSFVYLVSGSPLYNEL